MKHAYDNGKTIYSNYFFTKDKSGSNWALLLWHLIVIRG